MTNHMQRQQEQQLISVGIGVGAIWTSVGAISLFAPDMVSGSEQQHMPVAVFTSWIFGLLATQAVVTFWGRTRRVPTESSLHRIFAWTVAAIWGAAGAVAVFGPVMVTGTDPTRMPLCAILAPLVATVVTHCIAQVAKTFVMEEDASPAPAPTPAYR